MKDYKKENLPLIKVILDEYRKLPLLSFDGKTLAEKLDARANAAIEAAEDIETIYGYIISM